MPTSGVWKPPSRMLTGLQWQAALMSTLLLTAGIVKSSQLQNYPSQGSVTAIVPPANLGTPLTCTKSQKPRTDCSVVPGESQLTPESCWPTRKWETGMFLNYGLLNCDTSEALDTGWVHGLTQNLQRIGGLWWSLQQGGLHINRFLQFLMTLVLFMSPRRIVPRSSTQPLLGNAVHLQLHIHQDSLLLLLHLPSSQSLRSQPSRLFEVSK